MRYLQERKEAVLKKMLRKNTATVLTESEGHRDGVNSSDQALFSLLAAHTSNCSNAAEVLDMCCQTG